MSRPWKGGIYMESIVYYEAEFNKFSLELFEQQDADCFVGTRLCRKEERLSEMKLDDCEFFAICDVLGDGEYTIFWLQEAQKIMKEAQMDGVDCLECQFDWWCRKVKLLSSLSYHREYRTRFCLVKDYNVLSAICDERRRRKFLAMQ